MSGGDAALPESTQTVPAVLAWWAERTPHAPALIAAGGATITYAGLWPATSDLAAALRRHGVRRQDRIVLLLPEGPDLAMAVLGTMSAAVAVALAAATPAAELAAALRGLHATHAIVAPSLTPEQRSCLTRHGVAILTMGDDLAPPSAALAGGPARLLSPDAGPQPDDVALIGHSSGTTGAPKRVPRTHGRIVATGRIHRDRFALQGRDRALAVAPLTIALGRSGFLHGIVAGASLIFPPSFEPESIWQTIASERPTWMHASAGFLEILARYLRHPGEAGPLPTSLRFVRVTAAAIAPELCDELEHRLGAAILPGYSSSDVGLIATALPPPARRKPGSVGRPLAEVRIVDEAGHVAGANAEGEVWVRGAHSFAGYLDAPGMGAAEWTPDRWFRMGDLGYLDDDGFLFLTGRLQEMVNRGGSKIAPAEVDAALETHPAVRQAAAFAVPDPRFGEDLAAAVVLAEGSTVTARELRRWLLQRLAPHKVPRRIRFVTPDEIPLTPSGKVRRGVLSRRWGSQA